MSRIFALLLLGLIVTGLIIAPASVAGQGFATNTPAADPFAQPSPAPTEPAAGNLPQPGGGFFTNTPDGPTSTPSPSPTSTATSTPSPTASFTPTPSFTPSNTPTPTPTPIGPFSYPEGINPLTGLPYPDEEAVARRNLIVKISNYPPIVRPQYGVNSADVVYEYEAEGGVTRFAAIFRSQAPERVGSIRSARLIDMELTTMYRALLAYSGTSEPIQQLLLGEEFFEFQILSPLVGHDCDRDGFCRDTTLGEDVPFEHTLFGDTTKFWETATRQNVNTGYQARGFAFSEDMNPNGQPAPDIFIDWYGQTDARWQFDAASGRYLRFTDSIAHFDKLDGQQLWTDNIIIIEVPHEERPDLFPPGATYASLDIQIWDQGRAIVLRDGMAYQGFWRRENRNPGSALQVIYGDNTPIMLKPGRTWVEVVRWLGDTVISEQAPDMAATGTVIAQTPSPTPLDIDTGD